jgi:hypothetical protein
MLLLLFHCHYSRFIPLLLNQSPDYTFRTLKLQLVNQSKWSSAGVSSSPSSCFQKRLGHYEDNQFIVVVIPAMIP